MDENDDEFDIDFDMADVLAVMEQVESRPEIRTNYHSSNSNRNHVNTNSNDHNTHTNQNAADDFGNMDDDEFGDDFDDFDVDALVQVADTVEKNFATSGRNLAQTSLSAYYGRSSTTNAPQVAASSSSTRPTGFNNSTNANNNIDNASATSSDARITFGMPEDIEDPTPPPPPPDDAKTFHPFDGAALPTWIYPTNHPIRGYQFNIVRKALFSNTLVSIPTGLGKTFIAAVVMYNYYRWFPNSIMIFMAPTRPLVEQQIKACHEVCGIPQKDTVMMIGTGGKVKRPELWAKGRIFFCTPQVVDNDLTNGICPADKVVLLVIDEAHKATGNYAYSNVVEKLGRIHSHFRVLALSATPGTTVDKVQEVVDNLRINNIEVRTEESMDVQEFSFGKRVQSIVIKLDYTAGATGIVPGIAQTFYQQILQPVLDRLIKRKAIYAATMDRCTPYILRLDRQSYQANAKNVPYVVKQMVTTDFLLAETLARAYDGLCVYGVGAFVDSLDRFLQSMRSTIEAGKKVPSENYKLLNNFGLKQLLDRSRQQLATPGFVGHPKLESLLNIILRHFNEYSEDQQQSNDDLSAASSSTRIIVFSSLRASVNMIVKFLSVHHPLIKCTAFVGQSGDVQGEKGMSQKEQQQTIERFKKGDVNVMVATCIGEEGLDIGEVDLIVCYDAQNSPVRMLQRMGRTGRRRKGHCFMLMTEQEERKSKEANNKYKHIQNAITKQNLIKCVEETPALLPALYQPVVQRKRLVIGNYLTSMVQGMKRRRQGDNAAEFQKDGTLTDQGLEAFLATFPDSNFSTLDQAYDYYWPVFSPLKDALSHLSLQHSPSLTKRVGHSYRTVQFTSLVTKMENRLLQGPDISGSNILQTAHNTNDRNNRILQLPKRRKPTATSPINNRNSPYDEITEYDARNNDSRSSSSKLLLPKSRNTTALLMNGDSRKDSDIVEDVVGTTGDTGWENFMEPLMAKGMADDEDSYHQDYQSDYYQDHHDEYDFTVDNESPSRKTTTSITIDSDSSIDGNDNNKQPTNVLAKGKQPALVVEDDIDDEFDAMDLDFWDDMETQAIKTGQLQKVQGSAAPPPLGFLFDDDLPPLISEDEQKRDSNMTHPSTNFSTSFIWATSTPVFSEQARQILIQRLQNSNNHYLAIRLLRSHCGSEKSTEPILITPDSPPLPPSSKLSSYQFDNDDDIDFSKLDDIIGQTTQKPTRNQPKSVDPPTATTSEHLKPIDNYNNNIDNSSTVDKKPDVDIDNTMDTVSWTITDSQLALCDIDTSTIPQPKTEKYEMATEQERNLNNHQNRNDILSEKSQASPTKQAVSMDCDMDGGSMDSWEINDDELANISTEQEGNVNSHQNNNDIASEKSPASPINQEEVMDCDMDDGSIDSWEINDNGLGASSIHATPTTTPLQNGKSSVEPPVPIIATPLTAMEMESRRLMQSTPQNQQMQQMQQQSGKGDFENRSQYLYSPVNNTNSRSLRLMSPQNEISINKIDTPTTHSVDDDSHDNIPIIRRKRSRRGPIIHDSEDEHSQNIPNEDEDDSNINKDKTATRPPPDRKTISSDEEEADDDLQRQKHKNPANHRARPKHWVANPFLDNEAEQSDDGVDTGDDEEDDGMDDGSNVMDSFICDGSSGLVPEDGGSSSLMSTTPKRDDDVGHGNKRNRGNDIAMYRTSLLQRDVAATHGAPSPPVFASGFHRKTWLDKMETKKWEYVADDDEEDEDEVYHDASDIYNDAPIGDDGISEDISRFTNASDDFM